MVNPNHITPYGEIPENERELADDLVYNRREDALERLIGHFESKGEEEEGSGAADPTEGMEPEEALHWHILRRKRDGVEDQIDKSVEKIGAVPTLNDVLLPAMKEVGDKFGAGELILPFVLQSAEVMKRAVARLENYLDRIEGYTKGTVVLATVFGDVHDIGKSLVNTILTNNGYTVHDLGKQVPIGTIVDAAVEHDATAIGLSALLVSTSKQMPACIQELHSKGHKFPVLIGGAAINRAFSFRTLYPEGKESDVVYEPGVYYCKDAFEGLAVMDKIVEEEPHAELRAKLATEATAFREKGEDPDENLDYNDSSVRSAVRTDTPIPEPPFWGVQEIPVDMDELYAHLDTHVLFKLHWGGRGVKGEAWQQLMEGDGEEEGFRPKLERMWREQDYLHPRALLGFFPCYSEGNDIVVLDPEDRETELTRFVTPRQPKADRLCTADFFRSKESGELDVIAVQALTVGSEVTELMAKLEADGEFAEQLFVHGLGVQTAEGLSEWLHWKVRGMLGIPATQGRRLSWGYPAIPEQSDHLKVEKLLDLSQVGMEISDGFAPIPEQSTLAMVVHHPQAVYYGMRNGRLLPDGSPDDVIKGTPRDPSLFGEAPRCPTRTRPTARSRTSRAARPSRAESRLAGACRTDAPAAGRPLRQVGEDVRQRTAQAGDERQLVAGVPAGLRPTEMADQVDDPGEVVGLERQQPLVVAQPERAHGVRAHVGVVTAHHPVLHEQVTTDLGLEQVPVVRPDERVRADVLLGVLAGEVGRDVRLRELRLAVDADRRPERMQPAAELRATDRGQRALELIGARGREPEQDVRVLAVATHVVGAAQRDAVLGADRVEDL